MEIGDTNPIQENWDRVTDFRRIASPITASPITASPISSLTPSEASDIKQASSNGRALEENGHRPGGSMMRHKNGFFRGRRHARLFFSWLSAFLAILAVLAVLPVDAPAQARQNLALARVIYSTWKATVKPEGDLKAQIDSIDKEMADAYAAGRTGEIRRLLAKGIALLSKKEWTDAFEFSTSLVLRAEEIYVDPGRPYAVRLEQIYAPHVALKSALTAKASLHKTIRVPMVGLQAGEKVKDLAAREGVSRDLLDDPCRLDLDLSGVEDGAYAIVVAVSAKDADLGSTVLPIEISHGLNARLAALESGLKNVKGFDALRVEVLSAADHIRCANRGLIEMGTFKLDAELKAAEETLAALTAGRDPFAVRTGDMKRHYLLEEAGEIMPYRLYVPTKYDGKTAYPLIVALHGLGATEDSIFDAYGPNFLNLAEQHGYIVAAPLGYRVDGAYGRPLFAAGADEAVRRKVELSEKDVFNVLALVKKGYKIDESRIFLMGHSMGAIGTWYQGAKHPEIWAGLAPFSGMGDPATVSRMKDIPEFVVHGDADPTVPVNASRAMVAEMEKLGVEHVYIEVPGGNHLNIVGPNFAAMFDFFDKQKRKTP
jgi:poly(3-hydroxybutyrate) depolymerase